MPTTIAARFPSSSRLGRSSRLGAPIALAGLCLAAFALPASAHLVHEDAEIVTCTRAGFLGESVAGSLAAPFDTPAGFEALRATALYRNVLSGLLVNTDKADPCFSNSDTPAWDRVVSRIPADVVGIEVSADDGTALVYVTGIPDYTMETPDLFTGFKPGNIYGVYKLTAEPVADTRDIHEFVSMGSIGMFVNGVSIFNYTDSFSYNDKSTFSFDANVAEASIVNSDVAHATPSDLPQFPKSRGIFHNHQMSHVLLARLDDPYVRGVAEHSRLVGFAIDGYPIYGPLGHASKDTSSGIRTLKSSYVRRSWMEAENGGTGNRSSIAEWAVRNWDDSNDLGSSVLNIFRKPKADLLFADGETEGPVRYTGEDARLAAEIERLEATKGLKRDALGFVYWEASVPLPSGESAVVRNYLLKSSDLWGPAIGAETLPVSYQIADPDKFLFSAVTGSFAEDYEYVAGYGDLDFFNGIESWVPERGEAVYHYVASFSADLDDPGRLKKASFPYFVGIQYRGVVDPFNAELADEEKARLLGENRPRYRPLFDLGVVGKAEDGTLQRASVFDTWREKLGD